MIRQTKGQIRTRETPWATIASVAAAALPLSSPKPVSATSDEQTAPAAELSRRDTQLLRKAASRTRHYKEIIKDLQNHWQDAVPCAQDMRRAWNFNGKGNLDAKISDCLEASWNARLELLREIPLGAALALENTWKNLAALKLRLVPADLRFGWLKGLRSPGGQISHQSWESEHLMGALGLSDRMEVSGSNARQEIFRRWKILRKLLRRAQDRVKKAENGDQTQKVVLFNSRDLRRLVRKTAEAKTKHRENVMRCLIKLRSLAIFHEMCSPKAVDALTFHVNQESDVGMGTNTVAVFLQLLSEGYSKALHESFDREWLSLLDRLEPDLHLQKKAGCGASDEPSAAQLLIRRLKEASR